MKFTSILAILYDFIVKETSYILFYWVIVPYNFFFETKKTESKDSNIGVLLIDVNYINRIWLNGIVKII